MYFLSSYYWRQEEDVFLTLQQVRRKRGGLPVLEACICDDGQFAELVTEWFHGTALASGRKGSAMQIADRVRAGFLALLEKQREIAEKTAFSFLFCAGAEGFYAWQGDMGLWVLNTEFGRTQIRGLTRQTERYACERFLLEENVGIFLASGTFYRAIPQSAFRECLAAHQLKGKLQADRHLAEICGEALRCGAERTAAVLVVANEKEAL